MSNVLAVSDLHVTYVSTEGETPAVQGVTLEISKGETLGLAGESGCGKSTLGLALLRLLTPTTQIRGSIQLSGQDILTMKPGQLRAARWTQASVVFQGAQHVLNPVQRIGRQIDESIEVHQANSASRAGELLDLVGLGAHRQDAYPHELSGGQKQRALIAMALACDPLLLIADEPTTALDVMIQAQILQLLGDIKKERGLSMLFITHDLSVLTRVADRVAIMYAGKIVEFGPGETFLSDSRHPYSKALAASFPIVGDPSSRHQPRGLAGDPPDLRTLSMGCSFQPRCSVAVDECTRVDVKLRSVVDDQTRQVACVHGGKI